MHCKDNFYRKYLLKFSSKRYGKFAGTFFSTSTLGGGQETTSYLTIPVFTHLGIAYVPIGGNSKQERTSEINGGSPWGSGLALIQLFFFFHFDFILLELEH